MSSLPKAINRGGVRTKKVNSRVTLPSTTRKRKQNKDVGRQVKKAKSDSVIDVGEVLLR